MRWSEFALQAEVQLNVAALIFVVILLAGFVAITVGPVIDYVIRRLGGPNGFAWFLSWAAGLALICSAGFWIGASLLVIAIEFISHGPRMHLSGTHAYAYLVGIPLGLLGLGMWWSARHRRFVDVEPSEQQVERSKDLLGRWVAQWLFSAPIGWLPFYLLAQGRQPDRLFALLIGAGIGVVWATIDYFRHRRVS